MVRRQGKRCYGFISGDGRYAHCSREEWAGKIPWNERTRTYPHRLSGVCKCGEPHRHVQLKGSEGKTLEERKFVRTYSYQDRTGKLLFQVVRYRPKAFLQRRPLGDGKWAWNLNGVPRTLYRLPELLAADPKRWVYVAEGEKDARNLAKAGFLSTTNPGGAGRWRDEFSKILRGRKVAILPDHDQVGRAHAEHVAESLYGIAKRVKIVKLPGLPLHGDVSDWLANGGAPQQLKELVKKTQLYSPGGKGSGLPFHTASEFSARESETVHWIVDGFVASGAETGVHGKVKFAGKTTFLTHLASCVVRGKEFLGVKTSRSPVVYLTEQPWASFREALRRARLTNRSDFAFLLYPDVMSKAWQEVAAAAVEECRRRGARLLVVDTISPFAGLAGATENDAGHVLGALKPLQAATSAGIGVVIVQHERKGGGELVDAGRGSSAFAGAVDILLSLSRRQGRGQETRREIHAVSRFDETPSSLLVELTDHGYISHGEVRPIADEEARESIIEVLSDSENTAMTLAELTKACAISRTTAQKAIRALLTQRKVERIGSGKRSSPYRYRAMGVASGVSATEQD